MARFPYWIQRTDFTADDFRAVPPAKLRPPRLQSTRRRQIGVRGRALVGALACAKNSLMSWRQATLLLVSFMFCSQAWAHQDRIFPIAKDGKIGGIAAKFGAASLVLRPAKGQQKAAATFKLGKKTVHVPPCIAGLFALRANQKMRAHGSWWHSGSSLPPYLVIDLPQRASPASASHSGHTVMFNLNTGALIEVHKQTCKGNSCTDTKLDLAAMCSKQELKALRAR